MAVKTIYISKVGKDYKLSEHFAAKEMQCHDGTDKVLYSTELLEKLEELRAYGGFSITIISGYRTAYYNAHMPTPGAKHSQHIYGTAADVSVKKNGQVVSGKLIACLAQTLGFKGIGYMSETSVHLDMRASGTYRGNENANGKRTYGNNVGNDFYRYFGVNMAQITALKSATETNTIQKKADKNEPSPSLKEIWQKAVEAKITDGTEPKAEAKRGQVIAFVVRKVTNSAISTVKDCAAYAKERGISDGQDLDEPATRNQMIAMIYRIKNGKKEQSFAEAWQWAIDNKITDGSEPGANITREQAVAFVLRSGI